VRFFFKKTLEKIKMISINNRRLILEVIGHASCGLSIFRIGTAQPPQYLELGLLIFGCICLVISLVQSWKEGRLKADSGLPMVMLLFVYLMVCNWAFQQLRRAGLANLNLISSFVALYCVLALLNVIFSPNNSKKPSEL
jgi:uncharacterized membrane protein YfcA